MISPDTQFTCDGVLTQWRYRTLHSLSFKALVLRPIQPLGSDPLKLGFTITGINDIPKPKGTVRNDEVYNVPESEQIMVQTGDVIGWAFPKSNVRGHAPLQYNVQSNVANHTRILCMDYWNKSNLFDFHNRLIPDKSVTIDSDCGYREYSILATVESVQGRWCLSFQVYLKQHSRN